MPFNPNACVHSESDRLVSDKWIRKFESDSATDLSDLSAKNVCVQLLLAGLQQQTLSGLFQHPPNKDASFEDLISEVQAAERQLSIEATPIGVSAAKRTVAVTSQPAVVERLCGGMDDLGGASRRRPKADAPKPEWVSLIPKEATPPPPPKPVDPFAHLQGEAKYIRTLDSLETPSDAHIMFRLGLEYRLICESDWAVPIRKCLHRKVRNRVMHGNMLR